MGVMAPKEKKTKAQIALAAASANKKGGKKWNIKAKKDKAAISVFWDAATIKKIPDLTKSKILTISGVRDKLQVTGAMRKQVLKSLEAEGKITPISKQRRFVLYKSLAQN